MSAQFDSYMAKALTEYPALKEEFILVIAELSDDLYTVNGKFWPHIHVLFAMAEGRLRRKQPS